MKQAKTSTAVGATIAVAMEPAENQQTQANNLYISVKTFNTEGKTIGERIVDMYHFGTRNWLQNHLWWAMHHGACVETNIATDGEINAYLATAKQALADKFNSDAKVAA